MGEMQPKELLTVVSAHTGLHESKLERELPAFGFEVHRAKGTSSAHMVARHQLANFMVMGVEMATDYLQQKPMIPGVSYIIVSGEHVSEDAEYFLDKGADQYVDNRMPMREFASVLRAVHARRNRPAVKHIVDVGDFTVDLDARKVFKDGLRVGLSRIELDIFRLLIASGGGYVTTKDLLGQIDFWEKTVKKNSFKAHLNNLRNKLDGRNVPARESIIQSWRSVGYRLSEIPHERVFRAS